MALDDRTAKGNLTPEERRKLLRAFGDRMLIKVSAMDDPEDLPGVERAVRVAAVIERLYSRCDRSEVQAPDPSKLEAERARNAVDAIEQRVVLAKTLKWGEERRKDQGQWWDDAKEMAQGQPQISPLVSAQLANVVMTETAEPVASSVLCQDAPEQAPKDAHLASGLTDTAPETTAPQEACAAKAPEAQTEAQAEPQSSPPARGLPEVTYVDYTDAITAWRIELGLDPAPDEALTDLAKGQPKPPPPS